MFLMSSNSFAYTCAVKAPSVPLQYYYLHADSVFVGTVSSITNDTNHQYTVKFNLVKSWKGSQHPTITTYGLVACGYSLVKGEKYLVFASGYPPDYDPWATKPFDNAQNTIALLDSPQFQTQTNANEELYKKLVNAKDAISNMMGSKMLQIPVSVVGVDDLNFTLDVGIADKKAATPSGVEEYKQKLEQIVGNVPIRVQYEEYATALPEIITQHTALSSPLKQFKSGVAIKNISCNQDLQLVTKAEDGSPACVKSDTAQSLVKRGWALPGPKDFGYNPGRGPATLEQQSSENSTKLNHVIDIISISGTGSLPNPGGPEIQLTLMNIGTKPVTNLNATLVLNNNYTFNFKDVTESNPLTSGHSTSDTQILIGAGFRTELAYPIIISGITNNIPFTYTENVHMP